MQIINKSKFTILLPDKGYKLVNKQSGETYKKIYLGINDSADNYAEEIDEKYINLDVVDKINEVKTEVNDVDKKYKDDVESLLKIVDSLYLLFEPLLTFLTTIDNSNIEKVAELYNIMVDKGIMDKNDVPKKFKKLVNDKNNK